jgi:hypothetical protein
VSLALPPGDITGIHFLEADSTKVREFSAATQRLNQLRHRLPHSQHPYAQNLSNVGLS